MKTTVSIVAALVLAMGTVRAAPPATAANDPLATIIRNCSGCNFSRVDWHGRNLQNARFTGVDLEGANLSGADLRGARFAGVDLRDADLRNADLRGAHFAGCDVRGIKLQGARIQDTRFAGMDLSGRALDNLAPDVVRSILSNCAGCDLRDADLDGRDLRGVRLHGVDLRGAKLRGAQLEGARLDGSDLQSADFSGAVLRSVHMIAVDARSARFGNADLDDAVLCGVQTEIDEDDSGRRTVIHGQTVCAKLDGADLHGAKLRRVRRCVWEADATVETCTAVTPQTLRDVAHANLEGAQL